MLVVIWDWQVHLNIFNSRDNHTNVWINHLNQPLYVNVDGVKINRNPNSPQNPQAQERIWATKIEKTAIKFIINLKIDVRKVVKKVGANETSNLFDKAYSPIVKEVKPLLKWSAVPT